MESELRAWPVWHEAAGYAHLLHAEPSAIAWEWLRRSPEYRAAAKGRWTPHGRAPDVRPAQPAAARWGLHAFEDPDLPAFAARPVWRREWLSGVLAASVRTGGPRSERFDLGRFAGLATVVRDDPGRERILLSDGLSSLRLDVTGGSILAGPRLLAYDLSGLSALRRPFGTLGRLLRLSDTGRLPPPETRRRNARLVLLLRAADGLRAGAGQREIAERLLSRDAGQARWRSETPSLRLRAQRLVRGARRFSNGAFRELLA